jgi:nicotinamide-nucleotide amidase
VNLDQALVPLGFEWHLNPPGTAPGLLKRSGAALLFALPGVPAEMKALYEEWVGPVLAAEHPSPRLIRRRWYRTTGIGESDLYERIGGLEDLSPDADLAYLPSPDGVAIYVTARGAEADRVDELLEEASRRIREGAGSHLYAEVDRRLAEHVALLMEASSAKLATAESCTGGALANALTNVPGASAWFLRGWVVYADESKSDELGVPAGLIASHGAVSAEVAGAMAEGALTEAGTDYALAITGIAGPGAGPRRSRSVPPSSRWPAVGSRWCAATGSAPTNGS